MPSRVRPSIYPVAVALCLLTAAAQTAPGGNLAGFSPAAATAEQHWETVFRAIPQPERLRADMKRLTLRPHALGQPYDADNARWILAQLEADGLSAHIETFHVLFPTPKLRRLELLAPRRYQAKLTEPPVPGDPTSAAPGQLPPYNAYSIDGDVTAQLVFVNYGMPADYDQLAKLGVDVRGKIVIVKYGRGWRGVKPKVAAEHGAVGCIIYSDPRDDGYFQGDVFPAGAYRPADGVQRGSVLDISLGEGDPSTPALAAGDLTPPRLPLDRISTLTKIPTLPISYGDAKPLLQALAGPVAPEAWRGALPITYHVGPGPALVHLQVAFHWDVVPLYDVVAEIPGSAFPDQWVIRANHHDAWVFGADDPVSGTSSLLEEARGLGALLKQGWRPLRTIVIAFWDGEEPMTLGSTEWAGQHAAELETKAVAYLNTDNSDTGFLRVNGSHTLEHFFNQVARDIPDPAAAGQSEWQTLRAEELKRASEPRKKEIESRADLRIGALGSGSDYTAFLDHLGIASADVRFAGQGGGGVYHSAYDDFYWYTHFGDTKFTYGRALAETMGTSVMRLADAQILPFDFTDFADTMAEYAKQIQQLHAQTGGAPALDFSALDRAVTALQQAASGYAQALAASTASGRAFALPVPQLARLNELIYETERKMTVPAGLPGGRAWYKDVIYAPGTYTGYGAKTLPGLREAIEQQRWSEAAEQEQVVAGALTAVAQQIAAARAAL
ncbi:MAG: transferrin receptor-like dimerization domain-containing protein [Terriglobales bacterium]